MRKFCLYLLLFLSGIIYSQQPQKPNSVEIYNQIQKLNFLGSVLYVAAHPDDENTRLISYFSNEVKARTTYLSLTRGDGGQNLIGPELRELLGVIRTQELIEARKVDGGEQFFTRANDFGYSKTPDESLQIWDKDQVLSDVVWAIRKCKPDIIINRFDHRSPGTTHGHHTASAMLSIEAFDLTNDSNAYINQLDLVSAWQPKRLFFNTSWWFYGSREKFEKADKSNLSKLQTGVYYSTIGKSNQEIAALSRSFHQSQGFGNTGSRGEEDEYLEFIKGEPMKNVNDVFEGIDTSWNRVNNGKPIGIILDGVQKNFDFKNPHLSIPELVKAYELIQNLEDTHWKEIKSEEIKKIIVACSGLFLEVKASVQEAYSGGELDIKIEAINRSQQDMQLVSVSLPNSDNTPFNKKLEFNKSNTFELEVIIPKNQETTSPYWLNQSGSIGMYTVDNTLNIGKPDIIRTLKAIFMVSINGVTIPIERNIIYKYNDDVKGEVYQPLNIIPVVSSSINEKVIIFNSNKPKNISVTVKAGKENIEGQIALELPSGWRSEPNSIPFTLTKKDEEKSVVFTVTPSKEASEIEIKSRVTVNGTNFSQEKIDINYNHISKQMVLKPAVAKAIKLDIKTGNEKIAYIMGAGDEVAKCIKHMGYEVTLIKPQDISSELLKNYDVVITGIRAYNVITDLSFKQNILFDFVKSGKTMIVQYNTTDDLVTKNIAPYPLKISRDRVTEEKAEVRFLVKEHAVLNYPNKISSNDFDGWKQEQGLYYPNEWDSNFTPILSSNDKGENPKNGALLVAKYGKGTYIYTGLSFFRELPEGVPGAYRLLANLISIAN